MYDQCPGSPYPLVCRTARNLDFVVVVLALVVVEIAGMWMVFDKAGEPGWGSLIPFYNLYLLCRIAGRPGWWFLLAFIPGVGGLIWFVLNVIISLDIARAVRQGHRLRRRPVAAGLHLLPDPRVRRRALRPPLRWPSRRGVCRPGAVRPGTVRPGTLRTAGRRPRGRRRLGRPLDAAAVEHAARRTAAPTRRLTHAGRSPADGAGSSMTRASRPVLSCGRGGAGRAAANATVRAARPPGAHRRELKVVGHVSGTVCSGYDESTRPQASPSERKAEKEGL